MFVVLWDSYCNLTYYLGWIVWTLGRRDKVSKINRGSGVLVMLGESWRKGQCSGRRGPGKGRSTAAACAPYLGPGCEGAVPSSSGFVLLDPQRFAGINGPASWPVSRTTGTALIRTAGTAARVFGDPPTLPSWTHEDTSVHARGRDWSPEERRARHLKGSYYALLQSLDFVLGVY